MNDKRILLIAQACHAINCGLQAAAGETPVAWPSADEAVRASTIAGVQYHLENPDVTPEQSHEAWMKYRIAQGWQLGPVKDVENKIHPNLVAYADLPVLERAEDHVFRSAVHALKDLPLEGIEKVSVNMDALVPVPVLTKHHLAPNGFTPITYVGKRETYREGLYGTGLVFTRGQTLPVPNAAAAKMLLHPDQYVLGTLEQASAATPAEPAKGTQADADEAEARMQEQRDAIMRMNTKDAIADFVKTNFNQELDRRQKVADLQAQAISLIDRFGLPQ